MSACKTIYLLTKRRFLCLTKKMNSRLAYKMRFCRRINCNGSFQTAAEPQDTEFLRSFSTFFFPQERAGVDIERLKADNIALIREVCHFPTHPRQGIPKLDPPFPWVSSRWGPLITPPPPGLLAGLKAENLLKF